MLHPFIVKLLGFGITHFCELFSKLRSLIRLESSRTQIVIIDFSFRKPIELENE